MLKKLNKQFWAVFMAEVPRIYRINLSVAVFIFHLICELFSIIQAVDQRISGENMIDVYRHEIVVLTITKNLVHHIMNTIVAVDHARHDTVTWLQSMYSFSTFWLHLNKKKLNNFYFIEQTLEWWSATISKPTNCTTSFGI